MKIMFEVKIDNENESTDYLVFKEGEVTICRNGQVFNTCPDHYDVDVISADKPILVARNNTPVIMRKDAYQDNGIFGIDFSWGLPLLPEEHEALYDLYLKQMEEEPDEDYLYLEKIREDVERAKSLVKERKFRK